MIDIFQRQKTTLAADIRNLIAFRMSVTKRQDELRLMRTLPAAT
jgi:hypothetical protein